MHPQTTPHLIGEKVECAFMTEALNRGLRVARPYSAVSPYDVIVDNGEGHLWRVQVRSVGSYGERKRQRKFRVQVSRCNHSEKLTEEHTDFVAILAVPCATWYIIPVNALPARSITVLLAPDLPGSKYDEYREAWHLLNRDSPPSAPQFGKHEIPPAHRLYALRRKRALARRKKVSGCGFPVSS